MSEGKWSRQDRLVFVSAMPVSLWSGMIGGAQCLMGADPKAAFTVAAATAAVSIGTVLAAQITQTAKNEFTRDLGL